MTTTKRYPIDPRGLTRDDFIDADSTGTYEAIIREHCHICNIELGHTEYGFVEFWRDAAAGDDHEHAWCDTCVDEPEGQ